MAGHPHVDLDRRVPEGQRGAVLDLVPRHDDPLVEQRPVPAEPLAETDDPGILEKAEVLDVVDVAVGVHVAPPQRDLDAVRPGAALGRVHEGSVSVRTGTARAPVREHLGLARAHPPPHHRPPGPCPRLGPARRTAPLRRRRARPERLAGLAGGGWAPSTDAPTAPPPTTTPSTGWGRSPRRSSAWRSCGCATPGGSPSSTGLEEHVPGSRLGATTIEQLLSHAGGAQAETPGPWWERTPGGDWDALVGRRPSTSGSAPGVASTTATSGMPPSGAFSRSTTAGAGSTSSGATCSSRSG